MLSVRSSFSSSPLGLSLRSTWLLCATLSAASACGNDAQPMGAGGGGGEGAAGASGTTGSAGTGGSGTATSSSNGSGGGTASSSNGSGGGTASSSIGSGGAGGTGTGAGGAGSGGTGGGSMAVCGNGTVESPETCDDGNTASGDYCSGDCLAVTGFCGDGILQSNETCDDGTIQTDCDTLQDGGDGKCVPAGTCSPGYIFVAGQGCQPEVAADHVHIMVDNFCNMSVMPVEFTVPAGQKLRLSYHNHSMDYPVDVWLSYGGGYLDLLTGATWNDQFEHCFGPSPSEAYADISTACSQFQLKIHCL